MAKIAIDVVLLPPDNIMDLVIQINKKFVKHIEDEIELDTKTCLPHITLAMGIIDEAQIPDIEKGMASIASRFQPMNISFEGVDVARRPDGKAISGFTITRTDELQKLHEIVMDELVPRFTYDNVITDMFYAPPTVNAVPLYWVQGFVTKSVREKYKPHLTLGMGVPEEIQFPIPFVASRIALCHLGSYCTCRNVLGEDILKKNS